MPKEIKGELWKDPEFIFTIVSLAISMSVFLYFLKQLLCATAEDWRDITDEAPKTIRPPAGIILKPKTTATQGTTATAIKADIPLEKKNYSELDTKKDKGGNTPDLTTTPATTNKKVDPPVEKQPSAAEINKGKGGKVGTAEASAASNVKQRKGTAGVKKDEE